MTQESMPVVFVSHGAPTLALDAEKGMDLRRLGAALPRPSAVLVVSAHWEATPPRVGTTRNGHLLFDFSGFPRALYDVEYAAPGAPDLAARVATLLSAPRDEARAWDHGVWVPLLHLLPAADVPVLQISLPSRAPREAIFDLGRQLAPLADDGVLLLASGGMVHDFGSITWRDDAPAPTWAVEFEREIRATLRARDWQRLIDAERRLPQFRRAHPTPEHFLPLLVAAGAASTRDGEITFPIEGFELGSLGRTAVRFDRAQLNG